MRKKKKDPAFNKILYVYVELNSYNYAHRIGRKNFGSMSAYVNKLIANDRNVSAKSGHWQPTGENQ